MPSFRRSGDTNLGCIDRCFLRLRESKELSSPQTYKTSPCKLFPFFLLLIAFARPSVAEDYQSILEAYKRELFAKGLAEGGYFRSTGIMQDSVIDSERTVFVTYMGGSHQGSDLGVIKPVQARNRRGKDHCLNYVDDTDNVVFETNVVIDQQSIGEDRVARNVANALAGLIESGIRQVNESRVERAGTEYQYLISTPLVGISSATLTYKIKVDKTTVIGQRAFQRLGGLLTLGLAGQKGPKYIASIDLVLSQDDLTVDEWVIARGFDLSSVISSSDLFSFVETLFSDLPEQVMNLVNGTCLSLPRLEAVAAYDGLRLSAGKRLGVREGQEFLISPKIGTFENDGLLAALDMIHIAKAVDVVANSSKLNIVSEGGEVVTGATYDVAILE